MGKSIRDLIRDNGVDPDKMTPRQKAQYEALKKKVSTYKSDAEIMSELNRLKKSKEVQSMLRGKEIDMFASKLMPMLDREQKQKLRELVDYFKKG